MIHFNSSSDEEDEDNDYKTPLKVMEADVHHIDQSMVKKTEIKETVTTQRPRNIVGNVYFDFRDAQYKQFHSNLPIDPSYGIYHEGMDQCLYYATNRTWKSLPMTSFSPHIPFVTYKSGPMLQPDWDDIRSSLMTPPPSVRARKAQPPKSAFRPIKPSKPPILSIDVQPGEEDLWIENAPHENPQVDADYQYARHLQNWEFAQARSQGQQTELAPNRSNVKQETQEAGVAQPRRVFDQRPKPQRPPPKKHVWVESPEVYREPPQRVLPRNPTAQTEMYDQVIRNQNNRSRTRHQQTNFSPPLQTFRQHDPPPRRQKQWTSTPRDQNFSPCQLGFRQSFNQSMHQSLVSILSSQAKVQRETAQALTKIADLQHGKANEAFLADLPQFRGEPEQCLDWVLKVEKIACLTGRHAQELALFKSDGPVYKLLSGLSPRDSWDKWKQALGENFSNLHTKERASCLLKNIEQESGQSMQEFIYLFTKLLNFIESK